MQDYKAHTVECPELLGVWDFVSSKNPASGMSQRQLSLYLEEKKLPPFTKKPCYPSVLPYEQNSKIWECILGKSFWLEKITLGKSL